MSQPLSQIDKNEFDHVKQAYYNIYAFVKSDYEGNNAFKACIDKWGEQLNIPDEALTERESISFKIPENKLASLEEIYDIVYMIYLDGVIEDVELSLTIKFAEKLGFEKHVVGDLLKAIVTAPYDGIPKEEVRNELTSYLKQILE
ncbi:hypothetical protein [Marinigracilibium pacificum]|uniref:TerB family tellurite resistance protein n=1 Tax=Marinigracilibium pacificum TaxID=2729599 RepID=A0A848IUA4_9BACT|nr:hypothetical protein [Marinigracilibium pacificum]NMM46791.1 hypothetical protein [Marinigracilibium pacificum]